MAAQSVTTTRAAQEFLLALSNVAGDNFGTCGIWKEERQQLFELFPAADDAPLIPVDRLGCPHCLTPGIIATQLGPTAADVAGWPGEVE
jgi:hypothetical protein